MDVCVTHMFVQTTFTPKLNISVLKTQISYNSKTFHALQSLNHFINSQLLINKSFHYIKVQPYPFMPLQENQSPILSFYVTTTQS